MLQQAKQRLREVQEELRREKIKEQIYRNRYEDRLFKSNQPEEKKQEEPEEENKYDIFGSEFYVSPQQYETNSRQERLQSLKKRSASALNYLKDKNRQTVLVPSVPKPHHLNILQPAMRPIQEQELKEEESELKEEVPQKKKLKRKYNKKILTPLQELIKYKKKLLRKYDKLVFKSNDLLEEINVVERQIAELQQ